MGKAVERVELSLVKAHTAERAGKLEQVKQYMRAGEKTFYHGSAHEFKPGDILGGKGEPVFYADTPRVANLYGQLAANRMHGGTFPPAPETHHVYEVQPMDEPQADPAQEFGGEHKGVRAKVIRKIS